MSSIILCKVTLYCFGKCEQTSDINLFLGTQKPPRPSKLIRDCPSLQCFGKLAPTTNGRVWSLIHPGCLGTVTSPPSTTQSRIAHNCTDASPAGSLQVGVEAPHPAPCLCYCAKLCKNCAKLCKTRVQLCKSILWCTVPLLIHTAVHTYLNKCVHLQHKVVQNVPCTMLHSQNPFPLHIS